MSLDFYLEVPGMVEVFSTNITHNLGKMAKAAGIYEALWRPDENPAFKTAWDLVPVLQAGYEALKADPERFEQYNAPNGWGTYKHFVPFVEEVLRECMEYPHAAVRVSR